MDSEFSIPRRQALSTKLLNHQRHIPIRTTLFREVTTAAAPDLHYSHLLANTIDLLLTAINKQNASLIGIALERAVYVQTIIHEKRYPHI